jgi:ribonuclease Z
MYPASGEPYVQRLLHASLYDHRAHLALQPLDAHTQPRPHRGLAVRALPLEHRVESWGYRIEEPAGRNFVPEQLDALGISGVAVGRLQRDGELRVDGRVVRLEEVTVARAGQVVAFVMDTRVCDNAYQLARDADLLVCESTFLDEEADLAASYGHLTAGQAATIARDAGAKMLVLAHFSQRHPDASEYAREAQEFHRDAVAAEDGMHVRMPRRVRPASNR